MKKKGKRIIVLLLVCLLAFSASGCKQGIRFTAGLGDTELFRLEDEVCTRQEAMLFILSQKASYEGAYGTAIWDVKIEDETFSEYLRDNLQDFLAKMKCMVLMAEKYEVELTDEEQLALLQASQAYFSGLSEEVVQASGIRQTDVETVFHDYYIANKLMNQLTADVSEEISEDEARVITVQQIFLSTEGLSDADKEAKRAQAVDLKAQADAGTDFAALAEGKNEAEEFELTIARGDTETRFEAAAFSLSSGQISDVIETDYGFHIIKCVNNYDEQATAEHKEALKRKHKEDRFYEYYDEFVKTIVAEYNEKAWEKIDYRESYGTPGVDFYEIYNQYFGEVG